ncbi:hypothetical protein BDV35DRAFT_342633 [Aspergillus flavus]|uniref:Uncharacterized protein n=1 Tax=Aspergillus flavus TaxID=5059 RepID=A0A5N6H915_ASPFL|nr:hypothetical protein BDV35DRAFT_342633 [Aspergillus flavus]
MKVWRLECDWKHLTCFPEGVGGTCCVSYTSSIFSNLEVETLILATSQRRGKRNTRRAILKVHP